MAWCVFLIGLLAAQEGRIGATPSESDIEGSTTGGLASGVLHRTPVFTFDGSCPPGGWGSGGAAPFPFKTKPLGALRQIGRLNRGY